MPGASLPSCSPVLTAKRGFAAPARAPACLQNAMTVPNWNRCAQTMFDIMVSQAESGSPGGTLSLPAKFCYHRSCSCVPGARRWLPGAPSCATHHTSPEPLLRRCLGCPQALLEENRHISLTDSPPEEERADEPEAGTPTLVRCAEGCAVLRCAVRCGAVLFRGLCWVAGKGRPTAGLHGSITRPITPPSFCCIIAAISC